MQPAEPRIPDLQIVGLTVSDARETTGAHHGNAPVVVDLWFRARYPVPDAGWLLALHPAEDSSDLGWERFAPERHPIQVPLGPLPVGPGHARATLDVSRLPTGAYMASVGLRSPSDPNTVYDLRPFALPHPLRIDNATPASAATGELQLLHHRLTSRAHNTPLRVALVQLPPWDAATPPLGLAYVATAVQRAGHQVTVLDLNQQLSRRYPGDVLLTYAGKEDWIKARPFERLVQRFAAEIRGCVEQVLAFKPDVVGFSNNQNSPFIMTELAYRLRTRCNALLVAGGWGCFNAHERMAQRAFGIKRHRFTPIDLSVIGEGEQTLCELLERYARNEPYVGLPGVHTHGDPLLPRPYIADLDGVAPPTYDGFQLAHYGNGKTVSVITARGCSGNCIFCNDRRYQGRLRPRSPEHVVQELDYLVRRQGYATVSFTDLLINGNLSQLRGWCELVVQRGLRFQWLAQAVVRPDMTADDFRLLKRAGCRKLCLGVESGSDRMLRAMRKRFNVAMADAFIHAAHEAGIRVEVNLIVGFPGETEEDFQQTLAFLERNARAVGELMSVNTCNVSVYSELYEQRERLGLRLPDDPRTQEMEWFTDDGNTLALRRERLGRLLCRAAELGLAVAQSNYAVDLTGPDGVQ